MKRSEIMEKVCHAGPDRVKFHKNGEATAIWSYFYRFDRTPAKLAERVRTAIPEAEIVDAGDHIYNGFCGGAEPGSAKDSYMWVRFKVVA